MEIKADIRTDNAIVVGDNTLCYGRKTLGFRFAKRSFDIVCSLLGLIVLSPVFLIAAVAIKLDDGGAVIHRRYCIGKDGNSYVMYKFRTMCENADNMMNMFSGEQKERYMRGEKLADDPRITQIGHILRKTSIDELPQLFSVLKGDMSIVGPRPVIDREAEAYGVDKNKLLSVRAGITGIWQVYGRGEIAYLSKEAMDMQLRYVDECSIYTDFKILWKTAAVVCKGKGAR